MRIGINTPESGLGGTGCSYEHFCQRAPEGTTGEKKYTLKIGSHSHSARALRSKEVTYLVLEYVSAFVHLMAVQMYQERSAVPLGTAGMMVCVCFVLEEQQAYRARKHQHQPQYDEKLGLPCRNKLLICAPWLPETRDVTIHIQLHIKSQCL